jgi:hypothetical protein
MSALDPLSLLASGLADLKVANATQARAIAQLEAALQTGLQQGIEALPESPIPVTEHRRTHRAGPIPKILTDPELQAFISARVDRMTFAQIAEDIAQHFPKARRVGRTAIWEWWHKHLKTAGAVRS